MGSTDQRSSGHPSLHKVTTIVSVLAALRRLRAHDRWTREQLQQHQQRALAVLREYAVTHSTFYRSFHHQHGDAPLRDLPILPKRLLMDNFDALVTDPRIRPADVREHLARSGVDRFCDRYEVVSTSGTTGMPGIFLFDSPERTTIIASYERGREWAGLTLSLTKPSRMAVITSPNDRNLSLRVA